MAGNTEDMIQTVRLDDDDHDAYLVVAAIDFGTTYSGYAFAMRHSAEDDPRKIAIIMNKNWGESANMQSFKTPTSVLIDDQYKLVAFGYEAEDKFTGDDEENEDDDGKGGKRNLHLFRHFKMMLFEDKGKEKLTKDIVFRSIDGFLCRGKTVFALALEYLKDHLLQAVEKAIGRKLSPFLVKWVITVPAIWRDEAKQFMREAALEGGLINSLGSRKLLIALEPEGASIECRNTETCDYRFSTAKQRSIYFDPGIRYLVVDAGGGTVDITGHEVINENSVKEVIPPSGGDWGGTKVDENFINMLNDLFGKEFVLEFKESHPYDWLQMVMAFQKVKCSENQEAKSLKIQLPYNLLHYDTGIAGQSITQVINSQSQKGVSFSSGYLVMKKTLITSFFDPVVSKITEHVQHLLDSSEMSSCSFIFLVGGFGNSSILHSALAKAVEQPVVVPPDAQMVVLKGAVRFGMIEHTISSRIARRTYGFSTSTQKIEAKHRKEKIVIKGKNKTKFADDVFSPLISIGDCVEVGTVSTRIGKPMTETQTLIKKTVCASDLPADKIVHVDDPGVHKVGEIQLKLSRSDAPLEKRTIKYEISFGGTEILVKATDELSGNYSETIIDFLAT